MQRVIALYVAGWVLLAGVAHGQQFEVASVKPSRAAEGMAEGMLRAQDSMYEAMRAGFLPLNGMRVAFG